MESERAMKLASITLEETPTVDQARSPSVDSMNTRTTEAVPWLATTRTLKSTSRAPPSRG